MIPMRIARIAPLLLPLLFVSATCVTGLRRHGTTGPWVGEVTNYSESPVAGVYVLGFMTDAEGNDLGGWQATTCPSQLEPGETGTFEIYSYEGTLPDGSLPRPPYELIMDPGIQGYPVEPRLPTDPYSGYTGEGLTTRVVGKDPARRFALIEMKNESAFTYQYITVCANLRTPAGTLAEVGSANPFPTTLRPGETQTFPIFFNSMPDGDIEAFPRGSNYGGSQITLPGGSFTVTATKVVDSGTALRVVGETRNDSGQALYGTSLAAHIEGSWADRAEYVTAGCGGALGSGTSAPSSFTLPLAPGARTPAVAIEGVQGFWGGGASYAPPVTGVTAIDGPKSASALPTKRVSATISNPTSTWIVLEGACMALRDARGRLVGAAAALDNLEYNDRYLAPGATLRITADVEELAPSTTAEAAAFGQPSSPPPPLLEIPHSDFGGPIEGPGNPE